MATPGNSGKYPWYDMVEGGEIQQGDILLDCPIMKASLADMSGRREVVEVPVSEQDAIIMTQSCDLVEADGRAAKVDQVIVCPIYFQAQLKKDGIFEASDKWEAARCGRLPRYHVLNKCEMPKREADYILVDLNDVFSLSIETIRELARNQRPRPRLNPPYREHLSQAFARFFMRVGLPVDIPSFA
jgi:hypothetical protein